MGKKTKKTRVFQVRVDTSSATGKKDSCGTSGILWKHIFIMVVLCMVAYLNTLSMDFVWDDIHQIKNNSQIKSLSHVPSLFTSNVWAGVEGLSRSSYYRPLFTLSLAVDHALWSEQPSGYHLSNMVLHGMVTIMVYLLSLLILKNIPAALLSASVFAVHPVHSEAVTWISGRNEMLWGLFMLGSFSLYVLYRERRRTVYVALSIVLFFLSLLSKEMAVTLPLIIVLYELSYGTGGLKKRALFPLFYALAIMPYVVLRTAVLKSAAIGDNQPLPWRLYTAPGLITGYLKAVVLPFNLKVFYDVSIKKVFLSPEVLLPLILLGIILYGVILMHRYDKRLSFSFLFTLITFIPVTGIIRFLSPALMADRYLYIPSVGFSMALGTIYSILQKTEPAPVQKMDTLRRSLLSASRMAKLAGVLIVGFLLILTFYRNYNWKDDSIFTYTMVRDAPDSYFTHFSLGALLDSQGRLNDAEREFQIAIRLNPDHVEAHNNLGILYDEQGRLEEALKEYQIVLSLAPGNVKAHNNLGILYEKRGQLDAARKEYDAALQADPGNVNALTNLALLFRKLDRPDDAARALQDAISSNQNDAALHNSLGAIYLGQQRFDDAVIEFQAALKLKPDYVEAHNNLGLTLRKINRLNDAVKEFEAALRLNPQYAEAHNNLGVVYILQERIDDAVAEFNRALLIAPHNEAFRANLKRASEKRKNIP